MLDQFGYEIKSVVPTQPLSVDDRGRWWNPLTVREPFTGAWQRNLEVRQETVLCYSAVYACVTLIASDISKLPLRLVEQDKDGIWTETTSPSFSPVMRKPNRYQNRIKFIEQWVVSKLLHGNTYVLKERDNRGVVTSLYVLDPTRIKPLVSAAGEVYYQVKKDNLSGIEDEGTIVPASEIIHDVMVPLYHPLCGVSPLTACGLAAAQGLAIQSSSTAMFQRGSRPSGILVAPAAISDSDARRIKEYWESEFAGARTGGTAVLSDGMKFTQLSMNAVDTQLLEQLKWSAETVCSCFHIPPYMIGVGPPPSYNNIQALNQQYYTQALQGPIESIELSLDEGLNLVNVPDKTYGSEFDISALLRMDTATQYKAINDAIGGGWMCPNEGRKQVDMKPVKGGDTPYLQQQNYSLAALDKRDHQDDPFASKAPTSSTSAAADPANDNVTDEELAAAKQIYGWRHNARTVDLKKRIQNLQQRAS